MPLSSQSRYRLPGQDLYAPVLDRGDFDGLNDSSDPGFASDNQIQTAAMPDPDPIPDPTPLRRTGPAKDLATAPPPEPSASPSAYSQLKDVPLASDQTGFTNKQSLASKGIGAPPPPPANPQPTSSPAPPPPPDIAGIPQPEVNATPPAPDRETTDQLVDRFGNQSFGPAPPPPPTAMDRLKSLQAPAPPGQKYDDNGNLVPDASQKPSWARRLLAGVVEGAGILGELRGNLRPGTAQAEAQSLLYPGYRKQRAAYETERADVENQLNEELKEEQIKAQAAQREGYEKWREAQAANISQAEADRAQAAKDRIAQQSREIDRKFLADRLKGRETDAVYQQQTDNRPAGWEFVADPEKPGYGFAVPPAWMQLPADLKIPGRQAGDMVPWSEFRAAQKAATPPARTGNPTEADLALRAAQGDKTAEAALKRLDQSKRGSRTVTNITLPGGSPNDPNAALTGDAYLQTLDPALAAQVKAISEGRAVMPSAGSRSQAAIDLRNRVFHYDPQYSDQRAQIRHAFTTGNDGRNIGALNTATVHLDQFAAVADAMGNGSFRPGNQLWNSIKSTFGASAPTNFEGLKSAAAGEMASALKGSATDQEIHNISQSIQSQNSPQQLRDYITEQLHVLGAKLNTYHERYQQQIPGDNVWNPVLPSARRVFQKHGIDPTAAEGSAPPRITTKAQFDALPSGAVYTEDDGNTYRKP